MSNKSLIGFGKAKEGGVYIQGLEELDELLAVMPASLGRSVMLRALRNAAKPLRTEMRMLAPRLEFKGRFWQVEGGGARIYRWGDDRLEPNHLKKSIGVLAAKKNKHIPAIWIGPRKKIGFKYNAFYRHWVEYGTSRTKATPFIRRAYDSKGDEVLKNLKDSVVKIINDVVKKKAPQYYTG